MCHACNLSCSCSFCTWAHITAASCHGCKAWLRVRTLFVLDQGGIEPPHHRSLCTSCGSQPGCSKPTTLLPATMTHLVTHLLLPCATNGRHGSAGTTLGNSSISTTTTTSRDMLALSTAQEHGGSLSPGRPLHTPPLLCLTQLGVLVPKGNTDQHESAAGCLGSGAPDTQAPEVSPQPRPGH